ncbi:MAG: hypothetical protein L5657_01920 [Calditerricola sp.]|nr:hypothetical protein [Calditerricola sp.]
MNMHYAGMWFALAMNLMITVVIVVLIWQIFKYRQTKLMSQAEIARDEAYRKLAEEAVAVQRKISEELADLRNRVEAIERMLREVE